MHVQVHIQDNNRQSWLNLLTAESGYFRTFYNFMNGTYLIPYTDI